MTLMKPGCAMAAIALLALIGCDQVGNPIKVLTGKRASPDEFQVLPREPLQMPRDLSLPVPQPGTPSPRAPQPKRAAQMALLGTTAGPVAAQPSSGEQALLSAANTAAADPEIRATLESDQKKASEGPYEPPTIWELIGVSDGDYANVDPEIVLDPQTEAKRLRTKGAASTPVDPDAYSKDVPEEEVEQGPVYPDGPKGRNTLP